VAMPARSRIRCAFTRPRYGSPKPCWAAKVAPIRRTRGRKRPWEEAFPPPPGRNP
jgi:hypothetical protein